METNNKKSFLGPLLFVICFVIGCLFLYWAVEYWVYNTFDRDRYEISKIQPAAGGDSWSFWKIDHRTGNVEYCTLAYSKDEKDVNGTRKVEDFTCLPARIEDVKDGRKLESNIPLAMPEEPKPPVAQPAAEPMAATPATPATPVAPVVPATPATPQ